MAKRVVIAGAGIAGLTAAAAFRSFGFDVDIYEQSAEPREIGAGIYLKENSFDVLDRLGLTDGLAKRGVRIQAARILDEDQQVVVNRDVSQERLVVTLRSDLHTALRDRALELGAVLHTDRKVVGASPEGSLHYSDGAREDADLVIGADGLHSRVARRVGAPTYDVQPVFTCAYYAYWTDVPVQGAELYARPERMILTGPTNDGRTMVIVYWPVAAFREVRTDIERHFLAAVDLAPGLAERVRDGTRVEPFRGTADLPGFYRRPHGPGWALVGDAGYHKDPITAQGITDAFRDAELLAAAIDDGFSGRRPLAEALAAYEQTRNETTRPLYELTGQFAALQPPPPEMQQLLAALQGNPEQADRFIGTVAGTVPIPEFFAPENIARIMGTNRPDVAA
jgi:2-polyprenyl-6-methoxyphenol hydroxylase-like FAD-dependent oxidoreductase